MAGVILNGIRKTYVDPANGRAFHAVRDVDLQIKSGECFSLVGPSGCGKTTLLRVIAGLERPDAGSVVLDGVDATRFPPEKRPTAMVFQSYALFPHLTVEGNVAFGLKLRRLKRAEVRERVAEALRLVKLDGLERRRINQISGGQQQRVALARVLAVRPKIVLMDEPLSNLDAELRRTTRSVIREIQSRLGLTLVYVTHDQEEALMMSDRLALMREGQIVQAGTPRDLYERPASVEVARFIGQRNVLATVVRGFGEDCVVLGGETTAIVGELRIATKSKPDDLKPGQAVWLALKPDEVVLTREEARGDRGWAGEVGLISFAGPSVEIEARVAGIDEPIRSLAPSSVVGIGRPLEALRRGDRVRVEPRRGSGLIYARETNS